MDVHLRLGQYVTPMHFVLALASLIKVFLAAPMRRNCKAVNGAGLPRVSTIPRLYVLPWRARRTFVK